MRFWGDGLGCVGKLGRCVLGGGLNGGFEKLCSFIRDC